MPLNQENVLKTMLDANLQVFPLEASNGGAVCKSSEILLNSIMTSDAHSLTPVIYRSNRSSTGSA